MFALSHPAFDKSKRDTLTAALNAILHSHGQAPVQQSAAVEGSQPLAVAVHHARIVEVTKDPARKDYAFTLEIVWKSGLISYGRRSYRDFFDFQCKVRHGVRSALVVYDPEWHV